MGTTTTITQSTLTSTVVKSLWEAYAFDCGTYLCNVDLLEDHTGKLSVIVVGRVNHVIHEEVVHPNLDKEGKVSEIDIVNWKNICDGVIENPDRRSCGIRG